jgi:Family of unknown function (DUF6526)
MPAMYHPAMSEIQNLQNHVRRDPPFLIALPILLLNVVVTLGVTILHALHHGTHLLLLHVWLVLVSIALLLVAANSRTKDLKVQDRVIRLEERLRFAALLPPDTLAATSNNLTLRQIVALRFASDAELPALVARTLAENLTPKQIKESIVTWRPDTHRV